MALTQGHSHSLWEPRAALILCLSVWCLNWQMAKCWQVVYLDRSSPPTLDIISQNCAVCRPWCNSSSFFRRCRAPGEGTGLSFSSTVYVLTDSWGGLKLRFGSGGRSGVPTYGLPDRVHAVGDLESWHVLEHLLGQLRGGEAHGVDVVGSHGQGLCWGRHDLQGGPEAVVNVHHWEPSVGFQVALKSAILDSFMENLDCIVWKRSLSEGHLTTKIMSEPLRLKQMS